MIIAHRGNTVGKNPARENSPDYIYEAIKKGYYVEVDVLYVPKKDSFWLGHDKPQYPVDLDFLKNPKLWLHAKSGPTLFALQKYFGRKVKYFFLNNDPYTIASEGTIWSSEGRDPGTNSICVHPERPGQGLQQGFWKRTKGICTDVADHFFRELHDPIRPNSAVVNAGRKIK